MSGGDYVWGGSPYPNKNCYGLARLYIIEFKRMVPKDFQEKENGPAEKGRNSKVINIWVFRFKVSTNKTGGTVWAFHFCNFIAVAIL